MAQNPWSLGANTDYGYSQPAAQPASPMGSAASGAELGSLMSGGGMTGGGIGAIAGLLLGIDKAKKDSELANQQAMLNARYMGLSPMLTGMADKSLINLAPQGGQFTGGLGGALEGYNVGSTWDKIAKQNKDKEASAAIDKAGKKETTKE